MRIMIFDSSIFQIPNLPKRRKAGAAEGYHHPSDLRWALIHERETASPV